MPFREHAPTAGYVSNALRAALGRPAELFLAWDGDALVARTACVCGHNNGHAGALGLYEAVEGRPGDVATAMILETSIEWAASQGIEEVFAPVDVNTWFSYRFPVPPEAGGRTRPPASWEPAQPPEYLERFRDLGFNELEHYKTTWFEFSRAGTYTVSDVLRYTARAWKAAGKAGFSFHRLDERTDIPGLVDELHPLCLDAFRENLLFEPVSVEAFGDLYGPALRAPQADLTHWVRNPEGRLVGFVFAFEYSGEMVVKTIAIAPSARGSRLSTALFHLAAKSAAEAGVSTFISALVRRDNISEFLGKAHLMPGVETLTRDYVLLSRRVGS